MILLKFLASQICADKVVEALVELLWVDPQTRQDWSFYEFLIAPGSSHLLKQSNKSRQLLKLQAFPFAKPPKCVSFSLSSSCHFPGVKLTRQLGSLAYWFSHLIHFDMQCT